MAMVALIALTLDIDAALRTVQFSLNNIPKPIPEGVSSENSPTIIREKKP